MLDPIRAQGVFSITLAQHPEAQLRIFRPMARHVAVAVLVLECNQFSQSPSPVALTPRPAKAQLVQPALLHRGQLTLVAPALASDPLGQRLVLRPVRWHVAMTKA